MEAVGCEWPMWNPNTKEEQPHIPLDGGKRVCTEVPKDWARQEPWRRGDHGSLLTGPPRQPCFLWPNWWWLWGVALLHSLTPNPGASAETEGRVRWGQDVSDKGAAHQWEQRCCDSSPRLYHHVSFFHLQDCQPKETTAAITTKTRAATYSAPPRIPVLRTLHKIGYGIVTITPWCNLFPPKQRWRDRGLERLIHWGQQVPSVVVHRPAKLCPLPLARQLSSRKTNGILCPRVNKPKLSLIKKNNKCQKAKSTLFNLGKGVFSTTAFKRDLPYVHSPGTPGDTRSR